MQCFQCQKKSGLNELAHFPGPICNRCFVRLIEKRVRKEIRTKELFSKHDKVLVLDDKSENAAVTLYLLDKITKHLSMDVKVQETEDRFQNIQSKARKIIRPWNLEDETEYLLEQMLNKLEPNKGQITILKNVGQKEVELFARLQNLDFKKSSPFNKELRQMLDDLEKKHPEIKFALLKSFEKIGMI